MKKEFINRCEICEKNFKIYLNKIPCGSSAPPMGPASWIPDEGVVMNHLPVCNGCWDKIFIDIIKDIDVVDKEELSLYNSTMKAKDI
jgi:hypothetical protein